MRRSVRRISPRFTPVPSLPRRSQTPVNNEFGLSSSDWDHILSESPFPSPPTGRYWCEPVPVPHVRLTPPPLRLELPPELAEFTLTHSLYYTYSDRYPSSAPSVAVQLISPDPEPSRYPSVYGCPLCLPRPYCRACHSLHPRYSPPVSPRSSRSSSDPLDLSTTLRVAR